MSEIFAIYGVRSVSSCGDRKQGEENVVEYNMLYVSLIVWIVMGVADFVYLSLSVCSKST